MNKVIQKIKSADSPSHIEANILLVEDNPLAQKGVSLLLNSLGCRVDVADCGKKAIDMFEPGKYDLVFMDIGLPDIKGYQVAKHLREIEEGTSFHTPILGLSAHATQEEKQLSAAADMVKMLSKPLLHDQAKEVLREYVVKAKSNEEKVDLCMMQKGLRIIDLERKPNNANLDEKIAWEMLGELISSLPIFCMEMDEAYQAGHIDSLIAKVHKFHGDLCYTNTPHLLQAVQVLEHALKSGERDQWGVLYADVLQAINIFKEAYESIRGL